VVVVAAVAPGSAVVVVGLLGVAVLVVGAHVLIVVVAAGVSGFVGVGSMGVGAVGVGAVVVGTTCWLSISLLSLEVVRGSLGFVAWLGDVGREWQAWSLRVVGIIEWVDSMLAGESMWRWAAMGW
jgi:hypothetical protein